MFESVIGRAQSAVQNTIDITVNRALVGLSFVVAAGLVTAAIAYRLMVNYGVETALLVLAALFAIVGLVAASVLRTSDENPVDAQSADAATAPAAAAQADSNAGLLAGLSDTDREMLLGLVTAALPLLAPRVIGLLLRNIPALLVIGLALGLLARQSGVFPGASSVSTSASEQ